jgi:hypothetical protein
MKAPSARVGGLIVGSIAQLPALVVLLQAVFDMHNRFSIFQSLLLRMPRSPTGCTIHHPS